MNFKYALLLAAVVLCAVEAAPDRERRNIFKKAKNLAKNVGNKISDKAKNALNTIADTYDKIEDKIIDSAEKILKKVGIDYDLDAFVDTLKGNIKACALSDEVKNQALSLKDNVLSCVNEDIAAIKNIVSDVTSLASSVDGAPAAIETAVNSCKGAVSGSVNLSGLASCAGALQSVVNDQAIQAAPAALSANLQKASEIALRLKATGVSCVANRVTSAGPSVVNIIKSVASCVKSKMG